MPRPFGPGQCAAGTKAAREEDARDAVVLAKAYDPILIEVVRNELESIDENVRATIQRTGRSPMEKIGDFGDAVCYLGGRGLVLGGQFVGQTSLYSVAQSVAT